MSLTREEWCAVWDSVKRIEYNADKLAIINNLRAQVILSEIRFLKEKIQQVIGQME